MASNSVGSVSISVLANIAEMVSDLGKAQEANAHAARAFQDQWTSAVENVGDAFKSAAELIGVGFSLDWLKNIVADSLDATEKVQHMADAFGLTTQTLNTVQFAAGMVGTSIDSASSAFVRLARAGEQAVAGNAQMAEGFHAIGISVSELSGLLQNPDDMLKTVTEHLAQMGAGSARSAAAMQIFGRGVAEIMPMLLELGKHYDEIEEKSKEFGVTLSGPDQAAMVEAKESLNLLGLAGQGLGNQFTLALAPAIEEVSKLLTGLAASQGTHDFFHDMALNIREAMLSAEDFAHVIGGWITSLQGLLGVSHTTTGGMRSDFAQFVADTRDEMSTFDAVLSVVDIRIEQGFVEAWNGAKNAVTGFMKWFLDEMAGLEDKAQKVAEATAQWGLALEFKANAESMRAFSAQLQTSTADVDTYIAAEQQVWDQLDKNKAEHQAYADSIRLTAQASTMLSAGFDEFAASLKRGDIAGNAEKLAAAQAHIRETAKEMIDAGAKADEVQAEETRILNLYTTAVVNADAAIGTYNANKAQSDKLNAKFASDMQSLTNLYDQLSSGLQGPYLKALTESQKGEDLLTRTRTDALAVGKDTLDLESKLTAVHELLAKRLVDTNAHIKEQNDQFGKLNDQEKLYTTLLDTLPQDQAAVTAAAEAYNKAQKTGLDLYADAIEKGKDWHDVVEGQIPVYIAAREHVDALSNAVKNQNKVFEDCVQIVQGALVGAFNKFNDAIVNGGNLLKGLEDVAKQTFTAILAEIEKLAVINPIMNQLFGGGTSGLLPTWQTASGVIGKWLAGDLPSSSGSIAGAAGVGTIGGAPAYGGFGSTFGYGSGLGAAAGIAGGALAGYGEYQAAGGGLGGAAGGAAYGVGAFALGGAISAGVATAAVSGITAGIGAGFAAIGPVGWVALAAMGLNMLTGGGLFGTAWKPTGSTAAEVDIGATGATTEASFGEEKKKALFGGTAWKWADISASPEQQAAADSMFKALHDGVVAFADQFQQQVDSLVTGTFKVVTDKAGKQTFTDTVAGVTRTGETQQQFMERMQADNFLAVLDKMGLGASKFVAGVQNDADKLAAAVQDFAGTTQEANTNLAQGFHFLALSSDQTLVEVMKFVEGAQAAGETLQQTYARLAAAQQKYDQFVAQFAAQTVYVDPLEESYSKIYQTMLSNIDAANQLAKAAGAAGAAESDLANIHAAAAQQMAAALSATVESAQQLAFSLGITLIGSLDQVNGAIAAIINSAKSSATATQAVGDATANTASGMNSAAGQVHSFGDAIQSAAQKAKDAIALLLGDLSPLNDQEKLALAMKGLDAGTVTKDQVLQIGRALYASSEAYNTLFAQVMAMPDVSQKGVGATGGGGGGGGGHVGATGGGTSAPGPMPGDFGGTAAQWAGTGLTPAQWAALSADDRSKLVDLLARQQALQEAAQHQQFATLAQQIAEVATAEGKDYMDVIDKMGIKPADLEKGLGLQTDAELKAYIENAQAQMDSGKQNTASIVAAIAVLPSQIADAFRSSQPTTTVAHPAITPPIHVGAGETATTAPAGSGLALAASDVAALAKAIGDAVGRQVAPVLNQGTRNTRPLLIA